MRKRRGFNPKRRIESAERLSAAQKQALANSVNYGGNPEHKRSPGDYGLTPPSAKRPSKTLCDAKGAFPKEMALGLLRAGVAKAMVSVQRVGRFPQNIWAVGDDQEPYEAQLENREIGTYHGYPMPLADTFRATVLEEWSKR